MTIITLTWLLFGSITTNIGYIKRERQILEDFRLWKRLKHKKKQYILELVLGIGLGPLSLCIYLLHAQQNKKIVREEAECTE